MVKGSYEAVITEYKKLASEDSLGLVGVGLAGVTGAVVSSTVTQWINSMLSDAGVLPSPGDGEENVLRLGIISTLIMGLVTYATVRGSMRFDDDLGMILGGMSLGSLFLTTLVALSTILSLFSDSNDSGESGDSVVLDMSRRATGATTARNRTPKRSRSIRSKRTFSDAHKKKEDYSVDIEDCETASYR